jgi:hypothetical protein
MIECFARCAGSPIPECLLLAQSGHRDRAEECLLSGVKRTLAGRYEMSAYDPKRTLDGWSCDGNAIVLGMPIHIRLA